MTSPTLILLAALAFQAPGAPFQSKEGGFSIAMPSKPTEEAQQLQSAIGPISVHFFRATKGDVEYVVSYSDYPAQVAQADPDKVLEGAANGAVGGVQGAKLVKKADRKIGQTPGKEVEFSFPGPGGAAGLGRARLYLTGSRMYSVMVLGPKDDVARASDAFFRSFALSKAIASPTARADMKSEGNRPAAAKAAPAAKPARGAPAAAAQEPVPAGPFTSKDGGFQITFPAPARLEVQTINAGPAPIAARRYVSEKDGVAYVIAYQDYPPQIAQADPDKVLDGVADGMLGAIKGARQTVRRDIKIGQSPGKYLQFAYTKAGAPGTGRARIYLAGSRLYTVMAVGPRDDVVKNAQAFMQSFVLEGSTASPRADDEADEPATPKKKARPAPK